MRSAAADDAAVIESSSPRWGCCGARPPARSSGNAGRRHGRGNRKLDDRIQETGCAPCPACVRCEPCRQRGAAAGTFSSKKDADNAWKTAEVRQAEGRIGDPRRGRQTFQRYVEGEWLPNHVIEVTTREGYTYQIRKHIMPWFSPMRMNQIMPVHVREWVTHLTNTRGQRDDRDGVRSGGVLAVGAYGSGAGSSTMVAPGYAAAQLSG